MRFPLPPRLQASDHTEACSPSRSRSSSLHSLSPSLSRSTLSVPLFLDFSLLGLSAGKLECWGCTTTSGSGKLECWGCNRQEDDDDVAIAQEEDDDASVHSRKSHKASSFVRRRFEVMGFVLFCNFSVIYT
ncbi:uncharacterized protein LOC115701461 isoform X2 [Cannabis sativa]|uniref:uncharacterized protein LOC115701461 isoform X2 n=1 Tax=Cannabis sativa TaxID=3483 RepID=UPI0011DF129F|nr:uncharacterized protein LOC115701461 isoform X2 [Cannabis sativa]